MKLNIGSSGIIRPPYNQPEWVNIDINKGFIKKRNHNFLIADATCLPFRDNSVEEIRLIHSLEHVPRKMHPSFYKEAHRVLRLGSPLYVEVPNFIEVCRLLVKAYEAQDLEQARIWTLSVYGKGRHVGDEHKHGFSEQLLAKDLIEHGFAPSRLPNDTISNHYTQEPVIVFKGVKI